jgi:hypothetical protein
MDKFRGFQSGMVGRSFLLVYESEFLDNPSQFRSNLVPSKRRERTTQACNLTFQKKGILGLV